MQHDEGWGGALSDLRILELPGELVAYGGKLLADLGADVIKVEPASGDPMRRCGPFLGGDPHPEKSLAFLYLNTNKRSITLDITTADGRAVLKELVKTADVLLEGYPPGHLAAMGLGYDVLRSVNPRLVMTSASPFGQTGPYSRYKGSDMLIQAMGGIMFMSGLAEDPPVYLGFNTRQSAFLVGGHACIGTLLALHQRNLSGEGQHVDISGQEAVAIILDNAIGMYEQAGEVRSRTQYPSQTSPPGVGLYPCKDGWVMVLFAMVSRAHDAARWDRALAWMTDEGFSTDLTSDRWRKVLEVCSSRETLLEYFDPSQGEKVLREKLVEVAHIDEEVRRFFATRTRRELETAGQERGIVVASVNTVAELGDDPHLKEREFFAQVEHPDLGISLRYPGPPYRLSETPWQICRSAPRLGEHNREVYEGLPGLTTQEVGALMGAEII